MAENKTPKDPKKSAKNVWKNQLFLWNICFKTAPGYMIYFLYDAFRYQGVIFIEHVLGIRYVLRCAEFQEPLWKALLYIGIVLAVNIIQIIPDGFFIYKWSPKTKPKLYQALKEQMYKKAAQIDLSCYDDPEYYNDFVLAVSEAESSIDRFLTMCNGIVQALTIIFTTGIFYLVTDAAGIFFVLASLVLRFLVAKVLNKLNYDLRIKTNPLERKRNYVSRVFYLNDYAKELRLHKNVGDASTATNNGDDGTQWAIESYYGRLNYNLLDRYLLTATLRADGSSSFGKNHRWGWFPSAAAAWRVSNEKFMKNVKWVDNLKLRLGWGLVGNQSTGSYAYGATMANTATAWGTGYYPANFANDNLKWESTKAWNAGIDLNVLNNRIEFILDVYLKKTDNLLMQAALPSYVINNDYMGMSAPWVNTGSIQNKGIEFTLNTVNLNKHDWQWRTGATLSINRNKLTGLNSENSTISGTIGTNTYTLSSVGGAVGRFYGYKVIGMFKNESDFYQKNNRGEFLLDAAGNRVPVARPVDSQGNLLPIAQNKIWVGDYIFEDINGDGKITEADRTYIGNPNPDFTFGLNNVITWKNFELSIFINGSVGGDIYNLVAQEHTDPQKYGNMLSKVSNYAQVALLDPNGSATDISNVYVSNAGTASVQRISAAGSTQNDNNRISDRFVENGSYLRLKTLSLAWNLPNRWLKPLGIDWLQVYGNISNLFTITGYDGYDPEIGAAGQSVILQGIDNYRYPSQRIYTFGLKMKF